jgi:hypothetical protein
MVGYAGKLKTQLFWWLTKTRPFIINDQYKVELLYVDRENLSAKVLITNLKNGEVVESETSPAE